MAKKSTKKIEPKKRSNLNLAAAVSDKISIETVRLVNSNCFQSPDASKGRHSLAIDCNVKFDVDKKKKLILVFPTFKLKAIPSGENKKAFDLFIEATFVLIYSAKSLTSLKSDNFKAFSNTNGIYNAWPYWREFVQNTIARMGLPPLTIPVFRLVAPGTTKRKTKNEKSTTKKKKATKS